MRRSWRVLTLLCGGRAVQCSTRGSVDCVQEEGAAIHRKLVLSGDGVRVYPPSSQASKRRCVHACTVPAESKRCRELPMCLKPLLNPFTAAIFCQNPLNVVGKPIEGAGSRSPGIATPTL